MATFFFFFGRNILVLSYWQITAFEAIFLLSNTGESQFSNFKKLVIFTYLLNTYVNRVLFLFVYVRLPLVID